MFWNFKELALAIYKKIQQECKSLLKCRFFTIFVLINLTRSTEEGDGVAEEGGGIAVIEIR